MMRLTTKGKQQVSEVLIEGRRFLDSSLERQILLAHVLKKDREFVIAHGEANVSAKNVGEFLLACKKRAKGMPIAYITGHKEFFGLDFIVDELVLIPRPETEMIVEEAILYAGKILSTEQKNLRILDLGTGSGCIAISIAKSISTAHAKHFDLLAKPVVEIVGSDMSVGALKVARKNLKLHGCEKQIKLIKGDLLTPFIKNRVGDKNNFDIIVANLPYIPRRESKYVESDVKKYEPASALWAGEDGMRLLNKFFIQLGRLAYKPKYVIGEFGSSMKKSVEKSIKKNIKYPKKVEFKKDLAGHDRTFILNILCGKN